MVELEGLEKVLKSRESLEDVLVIMSKIGFVNEMEVGCKFFFAL